MINIFPQQHKWERNQYKQPSPLWLTFRWPLMLRSPSLCQWPMSQPFKKYSYDATLISRFIIFFNSHLELMKCFTSMKMLLSFLNHNYPLMQSRHNDPGQDHRICIYWTASVSSLPKSPGL